MRRIATRAALDQLRLARRERPRADASVQAPPAGSAAASERLRDAIQSAFHSLSPKLQLIATLALIEGESYASIADALELPVGTVKSRVFRATRALKKELARLGVHT